MFAHVRRGLALARAAGAARPLAAWLAGGVLHGLGLYVLALRWVPLTWPYRANDLGIVSVASLARYPAQQELVYAALAVALPLAWALVVTLAGVARAAAVAGADGAAFAGALVRGGRWAPALAAPLGWVLFVGWPGRLAALAWFGAPLALVTMISRPAHDAGSDAGRDAPARAPGRIAADRALALLAATGALVAAAASAACVPYAAGRLPTAWAAAGALGGAALGAGWRWAGRDADRLSRALAPLALAALYPYLAPLGVGAGALALAVGVVAAGVAWRGPLPLAVAGALVMGLGAAAIAVDPSTVQRLTLALPDLDVVDASYSTLAEHGQRFEYVERWMRGEAPGRDFLYLYGPLMLEMLAGAFRAWGRSGAAMLLAYQLQDLAGILCVLVCAFHLLRTRAFALAALVGTVPLYLRSGIGGLALVALASERRLAWFGAGALLAVSGLYSHEFAIALVVAGVALCAGAGDGRGRVRLATWLAGAVAVGGPYVAHLAARGVLAPALGTMIDYPKLMFAGYSKVPYPALTGMLPLIPRPALYLPGFQEFGRVLVGFYLIPLAYFAGLVHVLARRLAGRAVTPRERLMGALAVYGLVSFRAALGHSCLGHQEAVVWPAVLLAAWVAESLALEAPALVGFALLALVPLGLTIKPLWYRFDEAWAAWEPGRIHGSTGLLYEFIRNGGPRAGELKAVVRALEESTPAGAPILCLPHVNAYHFYAGRPNPTRYPILISRAHRQDAVASLERRPPACVVYDLASSRLDDLPDRLVLDEVLRWVCARYVVRRQIGATLLLYPAPLTPGQATVTFADHAELAVRLAVEAPPRPFRLAVAP